MTHLLDSVLTEYDDTLSSDSYIDPIGTLIIWSAFGRQVFRNRINSISNDVRNFTLNLFHHYLVKTLIEDDDVHLSHALARQYQSKDSLNFKQACLIFLGSKPNQSIDNVTDAARVWSLVGDGRCMCLKALA